MSKQSKKSHRLRAVGYIRVSSKDQVDGYSLDFQTDAIEEYCRKNYFDLIKIYADKGISGKTISNRNHFQKMFTDGCSGKFDIVIVWKIDRFTRDIETGVASWYGLTNRGVRIVSLQDGIDSSQDKFISLIKIAIADDFRTGLIVNIKRGHKKKLEGGDPRIGLAGQPIARYWDDQKKIFRLKDDEAHEWSTIAKQYASETPMRVICEQIKKRGHKAIPTTPPNIRKHLRDGLGDTHTVNYDGQTYTFECEPIVGQDTIDTIIKLMDKRKVTPNTKPQEYLLTGNIYCAECGKKIRAFPKTKKGKKTLYYYHSKEAREGCAGIKSIRVEYIDAAVLEECFLVFGGDKKAYEQAIAEHLPNADSRKEVENNINRLKRQLAKHEKEKDSIVDKVINDKLNDSIINALNQKADGLDERIGLVGNELQQQEHRLASMMTPEEYQDQAEKIRNQWKRYFTGFEKMFEMSWKNQKYLIDHMFDGTDEDGRKYGVYVRHIKGRVFEYEIYGRFTEGARFMKNDNPNYLDGPELEGIYEDWDKEFQSEKAAYYVKKKGSSLKMGDTGLEPVTPCL